MDVVYGLPPSLSQPLGGHPNDPLGPPPREGGAGRPHQRSVHLQFEPTPGALSRIKFFRVMSSGWCHNLEGAAAPFDIKPKTDRVGQVSLQLPEHDGVIRAPAFFKSDKGRLVPRRGKPPRHVLLKHPYRCYLYLGA